MNPQLELVFKQLDALLRNANHKSILETRNTSLKLLEYFSSSEVIDYIDTLNEIDKKSNLELAVKLHNKARNLVIPSLSGMHILSVYDVIKIFILKYPY